MRRASEGEYPPARRQVLWGAGVVLVSFVAFGLFFLVTRLISGPPVRIFGNDTAAQSNLQNALTEAKASYHANGGTFSGLLATAPGISSLEENTDLTWTRAASWNPHVISTHVGGNGGYLVLTALSQVPPACFGILYLPSRQLPPVFGKSQPNLYLFVARSGMGCDAATIRPAAIAVDGFPSA